MRDDEPMNPGGFLLLPHMAAGIRSYPGVRIWIRQTDRHIVTTEYTRCRNMGKLTLTLAWIESRS